MKAAYRGILVISIALGLVAAACGGSDDPGGDDAGAAQGAAPEGDCEEGTGDPVGAARMLISEQMLNEDEEEDVFAGSAEACGIDEVEVEALGPEEEGHAVLVSFAPTVLVGDPGQELTVRVTNRDVVAHTFTIDGQDVDEVLQPAAEPGGAGDPLEVKVSFPSDGEPVLFYCRFHVHAGHAGALVTY